MQATLTAMHGRSGYSALMRFCADVGMPEQVVEIWPQALQVRIRSTAHKGQGSVLATAAAPHREHFAMGSGSMVLEHAVWYSVMYGVPIYRCAPSACERQHAVAAACAPF